MVILIALSLVGCISVSSQARSSLPVSLDATVTIHPDSTPRPQEPALIATSHHSNPTIDSWEDPISQIPTSEPLNVEHPVTQEALPAELCSPLAGIVLEELQAIVSSPYDPPPAGKEDRHHGVDFAYYRRGEQLSIQGTGVQAVLSGMVAMALVDSFPYGNVVIVESVFDTLPAEHQNDLGVREGQSLYVLYAHLEEAPLVQAGQEVTTCQALGKVGKSGNAGVAHLHLETRLGPAGVTFDRMGYYLAESTLHEKQNYLQWRIGGEFLHFDPLAILAPEAPP